MHSSLQQPASVVRRHGMDGMAGIHDTTIHINNNMNVGTLNVEWIPQVYWIFVGSFIALFTLTNILNKILFWQRIRAVKRHKPLAAKPKTYFWALHATFTALAREIGNSSLRSYRGRKWFLIQPAFGSFFLVLANAILLVVLCLYALELNAFSQFQNIAYRAGFVSIGQIPLIFLLAGKNNVIGWLTGSSYERINCLHRWVARTLLLTTTLHMAYWFRDWARFDFIAGEIRNDPTVQRGLIAWAVLVWLVFSSFAPIRGWNYEFFVLQHTLSYIAFVTMLFLHVPPSDYHWIWPAVAVYLFDRVVRALYTLYTNLSIFHPKLRQDQDGIWACRAEFTPLAHNATLVTIQNPPIQWQPGQHALFSCHSLVPLQSHPFTISSLPQDGKLQFLVKAHRGGTRRIRSYAEKCIGLPSPQTHSAISSVPVVIEGPFGRMRPLRQFDSVVLFAGATGATFTVPLLRDLVRHWRETASGEAEAQTGLLSALNVPTGAVTRRIRFVWAIKSREQLSWFSRELVDVAEDVRRLRKQGVDVKCDIAVYITCDERVTGDYTNKLNDLELYSVEELDTSFADEKLSDAKDDLSKATQRISIQRVDSTFDSPTPTPPTRQSCGTSLCRCRSTASTSTDDISSASANDRICTCNDRAASATNRRAQPLTPHPAITIHAGRPSIKRTVRAALEAACGEAAVASCGPGGLNEDCRRAVVALSDERAACKGSGAMGVYYWGEGFSYA